MLIFVKEKLNLISKHELFDTLIQEKKYLSSDDLEINDLKKKTKLKMK